MMSFPFQRGLDYEGKKKLLSFITSSDRVPVRFSIDFSSFYWFVIGLSLFFHRFSTKTRKIAGGRVQVRNAIVDCLGMPLLTALECHY